MAICIEVRVLGSDDVHARSTTDLLALAGEGDARAWAAIVDRFERLVWSVARSFRYDDATGADVVQTVWLRLAEHCGRIRDPERLASWLATTCRNECISLARRTRREQVDDTAIERHDQAQADQAMDLDEHLLADETEAEALRAFRRLSPACRELLALLCADPPPDYRTIAEMTGRAVGSIGPTRQRCLGKLRELMEPAGA